MIPKACIFDLDGTLVDSLRDIAEAMNDGLTALGLPPRPVSDYRYLVGEGIPVLCRRAIGETYPHMVNRLMELGRAFYRVRPQRFTKPFPGMNGVIERLLSRGVKLAVLSNKPHDMTVRMVNNFWPDNTFREIYGMIEESLRKPNPHYALKICDALGVAPADTWFVGDTPTDVETALRSGAVPIGVTWGFRTRDELVAAGAEHNFDTPLELVDHLFDSDAAGR